MSVFSYIQQFPVSPHRSCHTLHALSMIDPSITGPGVVPTNGNWLYKTLDIANIWLFRMNCPIRNRNCLHFASTCVHPRILVRPVLLFFYSPLCCGMCCYFVFFLLVCCQCLWIVHSRLRLRFSLTFIIHIGLSSLSLQFRICNWINGLFWGFILQKIMKRLWR